MVVQNLPCKRKLASFDLFLLDLVTKGIDRLTLEHVVPSPLCVIEDIAVNKHHETLHFDIPDLLGENGEALAF